MNKWIVGILSVTLLQVALVALLSSGPVGDEVATIPEQEPASTVPMIPGSPVATEPDTIATQEIGSVPAAADRIAKRAPARAANNANKSERQSRPARLYPDRIIYYDRTGSLVQDRGMASVVLTGFPNRRNNISPRRGKRSGLDTATASSMRSRRSRDLIAKL